LVANVREIYALNKKAAKKFGVERFNVRNLNELEEREEYQHKISKKFTALKTLSDNNEISMAWGTIKEHIKIPAKESLVL
jgi:hypothetical protein